jgi:PAS domain S-box-containing protein
MTRVGDLSPDGPQPDRPQNETLSSEEFNPRLDFSMLWQQAFDASPDMISVLDKQHRIVAVNKAMAEALQCSPLDAKGRYCFQLLHGENRPPLSCPHRALLEDGQQHHSEIYEERLNKWMLVSVVPLCSDQGDLLGSIHIARDITGQKQAEQALRESEERFRHLSEATVEGVLLSRGSRIIATNQVLSEMIGYSMEEVSGMSLLRFIAPADRLRIIGYMRSGRTGVYEFRCLRKDGTVFPVEAHSKIISYKGGMVYQTAIRDLTQQKNIEQQRLIHGKTLGMLELAGAVSHEFNQPLMALQGYVEIIQAKFAETEAITPYFDKMRQQITRLGTLTRKLRQIIKYRTKDYAGGETIIDIDKAASRGP